MPIIGLDDNPLPRVDKFPPAPGFLAWCIGWDQRHIGETIYKLLFCPGLFDVIWDEDLGRYRTWNPADPKDEALFHLREPAEPLIPSRLIDPDGWSWENRAHDVFSRVKLKNGTEICAYPSTARQAKQGDKVNLIWIDEDIAYPKHVDEFQDRLPEKHGRIIWSAWPHSTNDALIKISRQAEEQESFDNPTSTETVLRFSDNPFITADEKRKFVDRIGSDEERRARDYGEFMFDLVRMYPTFSENKHCIFDLKDDDERRRAAFLDDPLNQYYTKHRGFPQDWTRYLAMDPSHTRTAILIGVVPPPEEFKCNMLIVEKEIILLRHSAEMAAKELRDHIGGKNFEAFIIDQNVSRQTSVGFGERVVDQYQNAFSRYSLKSRLTDSGFINGCNEPTKRRNTVRDMFAPNDGGPPLLRLLYSQCGETIRELKNFKKKVVDGKDGRTVLDDAANPKKFDCMAALEYLAAHEPLEYVPIENYERPPSAVLRRVKEIQKRNASRQTADSW